MIKDFEKDLLQHKKDEFLKKVKESAKYLGAKTPKVKFWEVYSLAHFTDSEIAHIHVNENLICISEARLKSMNFDEIKETAEHEVSHLRELGHDMDFQNVNQRVKSGSWSPPAGVIHLTGNEPETKYEKSIKEKPDKSRCNYHLCRKRAKIFRCKYCNKYFCEEHQNPKVPSLFNPESVKDMETYHQKGGHPCIPYISYYEKEQEVKDEKYCEQLDRLINSGSSRSRKEYILDEEPSYGFRYVPTKPQFITNFFGSIIKFVKKLFSKII